MIDASANAKVYSSFRDVRDELSDFHSSAYGYIEHMVIAVDNSRKWMSDACLGVIFKFSYNNFAHSKSATKNHCFYFGLGYLETFVISPQCMRYFFKITIIKILFIEGILKLCFI